MMATTMVNRWRRMIFDFPQGMSVQLMSDKRERYGITLQEAQKSFVLKRRDNPKFNASFSYQRPDPRTLIVDVLGAEDGAWAAELADARPKLVKGVLAIEPNGPPFHENALTGPPSWFKDGPLGRPWGITRGPLTYSPAATERNCSTKPSRCTGTAAGSD